MADTSKHSSDVEYNDDNPWRDEETLRKLYFEEFMSLPDIADEFGITHQAVLYWFDKHEIDRRDLSDYSRGGGGTAGKYADRQAIFCANCGQVFEILASETGTRTFCSTECAREGYSKSEYAQEWIRCAECGESFRDKPQRRFCSQDCYGEYIYEGGRTMAELFRGMERRMGWIEAVFERDNYTCQRCGERGVELQAHHVTPVAEIVEEIECRESITDHELFNDVSNGQTLCIDCHHNLHYGGDAEVHTDGGRHED